MSSHNHVSGTACGAQDPGNLEGDLQAGTTAGYRLCWVLMWSTAMVRRWCAVTPCLSCSGSHAICSQAPLATSYGLVMSSRQQLTASATTRCCVLHGLAAIWVVRAAPAQAGKPRGGQLQALWWCMPQGYLLQMLSAKLGVVTGKNLAQQCRRVWELPLPSRTRVYHPEWLPSCCARKVCQAIARSRCEYVFAILTSRGFIRVRKLLSCLTALLHVCILCILCVGALQKICRPCCRQEYPVVPRIALWIMTEIAIIGADIQEACICPSQCLGILTIYSTRECFRHAAVCRCPAFAYTTA